MLGLRAILVELVLLDHQDQEGMLDQQVQQERQDLMVFPVTLVQPVNLVRQGIVGPKVKLVFLVYPDLKAQKVQLDNKDLRVFRVLLEYLVIVDHPDQMAMSVLLDL